MADGGVINLDKLKQVVDVETILDKRKLDAVLKTLETSLGGANISKYFKGTDTLLNDLQDACQKFNRSMSDVDAQNLVNINNILKALKVDVSSIIPGFSEISNVIAKAEQQSKGLKGVIRVQDFKNAFVALDQFKQYGIDIGEIFSKLGAQGDFSELTNQLEQALRKNERLKERIVSLRDQLDEANQASGIDDLRNKLDHLTVDAEDVFNAFLKLHNIGQMDEFGDYDSSKFSEYFEAIRNGSMSAQEAITKFKAEYGYLIEDNFKNSNNAFGLEQLHNFENVLEKVLITVEKLREKMDTLPEDMKNVQSSKQTDQVLFDEEQLKSVLDLFGDIKDSLFSLRSVISDVGDGQEFSPLLQTIKEITGAVESLKQSVSKIGLNINIDAGEPDQKLLSNIEAKKQNLLNAYQSQFAAMKNFKIPGSIIAQGNIQNRDRVVALNKQILNFDGGASADNIDQRIAAYTKVIELMREASKLSYGRDVYADMDSSFKNALSSAKGQLTKAQNELANSNALGSGIENLFGSKDLDQVVVQLSRIADKFEEIANAANDFKTKFADGINVTTSIEEIQKLTQRVQELEAELSKIKAINPPTVQEPKKDAFQADTNPVEKIVDNFKEAKQETEKATESAKDYIRTLSQVGEWNVDSKVSVIKQKNDGQLESWNYDAKRGKKNITYDKYGNIDYGDPIITTISNYKQLEQTIIKADNELRDLQKTLKDVKETSPNASTKNIEKQIQYQEEYISLLEQTIKTISHGDEYFLHEQQIIDARKKAETEYNLKQGTKSDISDAKRDAKSAKEAQIEAENIKLAQQKEIYNQLNDALDRYSTVSKTIANGKGLESDYEEAARLQEKIEELQNHPILSQEQLDAAQRKLDKIEQTIEDIETNKSDKAWGDAIAENNKRDAKSAKEEAKNIQAEWNENVKAIQDYMDAVTKLNNLQASDKGTGSKTNEIEDQKNKVEEFKEKALEARTVLSSMVDPHWGSIDTWDDWIAAMEKLDQAAYGSSESIAKLKDSLKAIRDSQMKQLQNSIEKYNGILENASQYKTPNTNYQNQLTKFQTAINGLKTYKETLSGVTPLTEEQKAKIAELTAECDKCAKAFKNMSAAEKGSNERSRMKEADKITKYLQQNTRLSKEAKKQLESYVNLLRSSDADVDVGKIHTEWLKVTDAERAAGREGKSFFDVVKEKAWYGAASAIGTYFGFNDIMRYGQQTIQTIVSLDDEMVDLKKTTSMSSSQLEDFYYDSNNVAKQMGATTQEIIDQASAWSRLGYNTKDASTEMAKLSSQFASISPGMATDEAQEGLVSIMKAWQIDPDQVKSEIMDPINQLGNTMAESNQDIVEGMKRSAAALAAVGTDVKDSFALFSSIQEVLQNSEKSGTSLRSVALRLRSFDESTEEYSEDLANITGELADLTKTAEHSQGVSIFKPGSTTEFKSLVDYFGEIHDIWDEMSQKQQNDFLLKAFGRTQAQAGAALIQNYDAVTKAIQEMEQASGSSDKEMSTVESSISYKINALKQTWVGTAQEILKRDDIGNFVTALTKLSEGLGSLVSNLGLVKTAALGISAALSLNNVGELKLY